MQEREQTIEGNMRNRSSSLSGNSLLLSHIHYIIINNLTFLFKWSSFVITVLIIHVENSEQFEQNVEFLKSILGDETQEETIKYALRGADGRIEIALNHLLNNKEKERASM